MLRIRKIKRYRIAKYPRRIYRDHPRSPATRAVQATVASSALLSLLQASGCSMGVSGPPPVDPDMMTEAEARMIVERVFRDNGVALWADVEVDFTYGGDTVTLEVDGYDPALEVGYEYVAPPDRSTFTPDVEADLDAASQGAGPYIATIDEVGVDGQAQLEASIQAFIDRLRSQGVL